MRTQFLYEIHSHTAETSSCGWLPAARLVELYKSLGYAGLAVTDHLHQSYVSSLDCAGDWERAMDRYLSGYRAAKEAAQALDFDVLLGAELRFEQENSSDYLLYGIDEDFLYQAPYLFHLGHKAFYERYGDKILIIQAHPYRDGNRAVYSDCIHGVEIVNSNLRHQNHNELARALCEKEPRLLPLCGSDCHRPRDEGRGAVILPYRVDDSFGLRKAFLLGDYRIQSITDPEIVQETNKRLEQE